MENPILIDKEAETDGFYQKIKDAKRYERNSIIFSALTIFFGIMTVSFSFKLALFKWSLISFSIKVICYILARYYRKQAKIAFDDAYKSYSGQFQYVDFE